MLACDYNMAQRTLVVGNGTHCCSGRPHLGLQQPESPGPLTEPLPALPDPLPLLPWLPLPLPLRLPLPLPLPLLPWLPRHTSGTPP